ncbi:hypothetical protein [Actinokineospora inagensis]|uniref:hypothetical protein n=1 Tax=Actinokineospora inagensis TaxID=103730 RepID=UPI0004270DEF|nr:hypothetical protein [Actinokineospora inagensis]
MIGPAFPVTFAEVQTPTPPPPGPQDKGGQGEDFGKSSPLGFLVLVLFFIAVAFLIRSMTKHLKRLPTSFDPPAESEPESASGSATADKDPADKQG